MKRSKRVGNFMKAVGTLPVQYRKEVESELYWVIYYCNKSITVTNQEMKLKRSGSFILNNTRLFSAVFLPIVSPLNSPILCTQPRVIINVSKKEWYKQFDWSFNLKRWNISRGFLDVSHSWLTSLEYHLCWFSRFW